jgi:hypothetical protein
MNAKRGRPPRPAAVPLLALATLVFALVSTPAKNVSGARSPRFRTPSMARQSSAAPPGNPSPHPGCRNLTGPRRYCQRRSWRDCRSRNARSAEVMEADVPDPVYPESAAAHWRRHGPGVTPERLAPGRGSRGARSLGPLRPVAAAENGSANQPHYPPPERNGLLLVTAPNQHTR